MEGVLNKDEAVKPSDLPEEVIGVILSNLEKADVLNSRLVNKSWNMECLRLLNRSKWTLSLNQRNIKKYVGFLKSLQTPQLVLPLDLSTEHGYQFKRDLEYLVRLFGNHCFQTMYLYMRSLPHYPGNMALLAKACTGLQKLEFRVGFITIPPELVQSSFSKYPVVLPNLKTLLANPSQNTQTLFQTLVSTVPNLKSLELSGLDIYEGMVSESIENLTIGWLKPTQAFLQRIQEVRPRLREFNASWLNVVSEGDAMLFVDILNCLSLIPTLETLHVSLSSKLNANFQFPVFTHLKHLRIWREVPNHIQQLNFDALTFPALESWTIPIGRLQVDGGVGFPSLKHLSVRSEAMNVVWTWNPTIFPVLESIALDFRFFYASQTITFPNVQVLRVVFDEGSFYRLPEVPLSDQFLQGNLENFKTMFPALTKIIFENISEFYSNKNEVAHYFCTRFLKEFLLTVRGKNLKEIQFLNPASRDRNYLSDAIRQIQNPPRLVLQNFEGNLPKPLKDLISTAWNKYLDGLKKVGVDAESIDGDKRRIRVFKDTIRIRMTVKSLEKGDSCYERCNKDKADFRLIAKCFPNLRELDVPAYWFESLKEDTRWKRIEKIRALFPGVVLNRVEPQPSHVVVL